MKRAAIYARVSTDEQAKHGYSIGSQMDVLRKYASENKYTVVGEYVEAGASAHGNVKKRPELMRLIRDVERDQIDTILFVKIDRWFRNVKDYYAVQTILDDHHVQWRAVLEDYETETSAGKFKVNIMLSIAQAESERTSERIKMVFDGMRQRGETTNAKVPIGIKIVNRKDAEDPEKSHIIKDIYQKYIDFRSYPAVARYLSEKYGILYCDVTARRLLSNHRYVDVGIIDQSLFDKVQSVMVERSPRTNRKQVRTYYFSGLCRCSECGSVMKTGINPRKQIMYACSKRSRYGPQGCSHVRYTNEELIEKTLLEQLVPAAEQYNLNVSRKNTTPPVDKAAVKKKMAKLADLYMSDMIEKDEYETRYTELKKALETVPFVEPLIDIVRYESALKVYKELDREHKRSFWRRILKDIHVDNENHIFFTLQSP